MKSLIHRNTYFFEMPVPLEWNGKIKMRDTFNTCLQSILGFEDEAAQSRDAMIHHQSKVEIAFGSEINRIASKLLKALKKTLSLPPRVGLEAGTSWKHFFTCLPRIILRVLIQGGAFLEEMKKSTNFNFLSFRDA